MATTKTSEKAEAVPEAKTELFDLYEYQPDPITAEKIEQLRYLGDKAIADRLLDPAGALIDCDHKSYSGLLKEYTVTAYDEKNEIVNSLADASFLEIEFVPKKGETVKLKAALSENAPKYVLAGEVMRLVAAGLDTVLAEG